MKETFKTSIDGYWLEADASGLPSHSGVYFVYRCTYNPVKATGVLHQLLYIGEGENVNERIAAHNKRDEWKRHLLRGEELCFSTCPIGADDRERVEAAYIFHHCPPCNVDCTCSFNYDATTVVSTNKTAHLSENFTVERT